MPIETITVSDKYVEVKHAIETTVNLCKQKLHVRFLAMQALGTKPLQEHQVLLPTSPSPAPILNTLNDMRR